MNRNVRLAAATVLVLVLVGVGLAMMNRLPGFGAQPSADPSQVRAALQSFWEAVGDRTSPGDWGPDEDTMNIDSTGLRIEQLHGDVLSSMSITDGGGRLVLRFEHGVAPGQRIPTNQVWKCDVGTEGTYSARLALDGRTLTLGLISDLCVPRAVFLTGDWTRAVCPQGYYACATAAPSKG